MRGFLKINKGLVFLQLIAMSLTFPVFARPGQQKESVQPVHVPAVAPVAADDPALAALLAKTAANAEKLKNAAFHFFCREKVTEESFGPGSRFDRNASRSYWVYDYQIVARDEKITENRVLLEKNRQVAHGENARLETAFRSFYPFYMPVRMLAGEKQHLYLYRLLGKKKKIWHIAALGSDPALAIPSGEIWVNEENGAVLKIQIEQSTIVGFAKISAEAEKLGLRPEIVTIHEYDVEENGIRFPSRTTFIERYNADSAPTRKWSELAPTGKWGDDAHMGRGFKSVERSRTYFEYDKYRFFSVSLQVAEKIE